MKKLFLSIIIIISFSIGITKAQSNSIGSGISLQLNGNDGNYMDLGDNFNSLNFPTTFECWLNISEYPPIFSGIFATDNDLAKYNGIYIVYNTAGNLRAEFGNGQGSGSQYRRGYQTTSALTLNKWIHVAVVVNSVTDIKFYFNGVEQPKAATDGSSTSQVFTHSSSPASIGHFQDLFDEHIVNGQMDESRLWNVARTQTDIRDNMCRKISSSSSGLIGYWTADESYSSSTVNDQTTPAENGTLKGAVSKITSGAPLGDDSKNLYASNWSGQKVKLTAAAGDKLIARSFTGNPYGVHVYIVNSNPYSSAGLSTTPAYYYGVFCADGIDLAKYKVKYVYSISNGTINSSNESNGELWQRADGSITTWVDLSADLDTAGNKISKSNQKTRGEYILNIVGNGKLSQDQSAYMSNGFISAFPNPVNDLLSLDLSKIRGAISSICILDVSGKVLIKTENENQFIKIDVSDFSEGIYFVEAIGDSQKCYGKFEVKR